MFWSLVLIGWSFFEKTDFNNGVAFALIIVCIIHGLVRLYISMFLEDNKPSTYKYVVYQISETEEVSIVTRLHWEGIVEENRERFNLAIVIIKTNSKRDAKTLAKYYSEKHNYKLLNYL